MKYCEFVSAGKQKIHLQRLPTVSRAEDGAALQRVDDALFPGFAAAGGAAGFLCIGAARVEAASTD